MSQTISKEAISVMKKAINIICFVLLCFLLSSCDTVGNIFTEHYLPARGTWHGHIYVNELMGIQFDLPETWFVYTSEQIARWFYIPRTFSTESVIGSLSSYGNGVDAIDMRARDFFNDNNITIYSQALSTISNDPINELEYLYLSATHMYDDMGDIFINTEISEAPRQIGNINWYYMIHDIQGGFVSARFVSIQDGFLCSISIAILEGDVHDIEGIWGRFSEIEPQFQNTEGIVPAMMDIPSLVYHGSWDGHVYTNPSLNLKFTIPADYNITTNSELAAVWGVPTSLYTDGLISRELWVEAIPNGNLLPVMRTYNSSGSSVVLFVRRKPLGMREFSLNNQLRLYMEQNEEHWLGRGANVQTYVTSSVAEISGHEWVMGRIEISRKSDGLERIVDTFITVVDNHVWTMQIESNNEYELQEILSMFSQTPEL